MQYARLLCILLLFKMLSFKVKSGKAVSLYSETLPCTGVYSFRRFLIVNNLAACYIPGITPFDYHRSVIVMVLFLQEAIKIRVPDKPLPIRNSRSPHSVLLPVLQILS